MSRFKEDIDIPRRFVEGTDEHLMKSSWKAGSDSLLLGPMIGKGKLVGSFGTLDESYSVSVSVSSAACRLDALTGFLDVLKTCTVLSDSSPAKCTFSTDPPAGITGSDWARWCKRTPGTWGEE